MLHRAVDDAAVDDAALMSVADGTVRAMTTLSVREHMILAVESRRWKYAGAKDDHIRVTFNESAARYYQRLDVLLDHPDAERQQPMLVRRLRRLRDLRRAARAAAPLTPVFVEGDRGLR